MNDWQIWFVTGIEHILDLNGYDHMMFVCLLVFTYPITEWKKLLMLITAFTIGHSLTLALSVTNVIELPQRYTELLIILTIIAAAIYQLFVSKNTPNRVTSIYLIICFFGLIHGLGFSYLLKAMLGSDESVFVPLLMFNIGLEIGQIIVVIFVVIVLLLVGKYAKTIERHFKTGIISVILVVALILCYIRILNLFHQ
ncbi:MAG TPA: HupE/UreJ family protein [Bacteroidia bacterium]|jgi:hypothetical protein|nr:HupE/UreJ family protein [Bacteroidia bacterium]